MTALKRSITPDEVQEAFNGTGLKPIRGAWERGGGPSGQPCGCGLYAACLWYKHRRPGDERDAADILRLDYVYAIGWITGWDGDYADGKYKNDAAYQRGYADGVASADLIFGMEKA